MVGFYDRCSVPVLTQLSSQKGSVLEQASFNRYFDFVLFHLLVHSTPSCLEFPQFVELPCLGSRWHQSSSDEVLASSFYHRFKIVP